MKNVHALRHEKEKNYYTFMMVVSVIVWLLCLVGVLAALVFCLPLILIGLFVSWLSSQYFKAVVFGNSIQVNEKQFPEIDRIVKDFSRELGLSRVPLVFVENGNGSVNAFAVKMLSKKYVILKSDLVDLMLRRGRTDELAMIIGH